jgi:hypothetical protein
MRVKMDWKGRVSLGDGSEFFNFKILKYSYYNDRTSDAC